MKPPWAYAGTVLLRAARSTEEIVELLDRAACLTAQGRAERSAVIALLEQTAQAFHPPPPPPDVGALLGWEPPSLEGEIADALAEAGYLDADGWWALHDIDTYEARVQRAIAEVRAADLACWRCRQGLPASASFCGYCGSRLGKPASVSRS